MGTNLSHSTPIIPSLSKLETIAQKIYKSTKAYINKKTKKLITSIEEQKQQGNELKMKCLRIKYNKKHDIKVKRKKKTPHKVTNVSGYFFKIRSALDLKNEHIYCWQNNSRTIEGILDDLMDKKITADQFVKIIFTMGARKQKDTTVSKSDIKNPKTKATSMFQCKGCKSWNVTTHQLQTRSGDEGYTTYLYCEDCGKRGKF